MKRIASISDGLPVEHLVFIDNKMRTIGEKRQSLLDIANGLRVAYVDDDDDVNDDYAKEIVAAHFASPQTDVITFEQDAWLDEDYSRIIWRLNDINEQFNKDAITRRAAWHACAWRTDLARTSRFPAKQYGEDWEWCAPLNDRASTSTHIPKPLHIYRFRSEVTEAK